MAGEQLVVPAPRLNAPPAVDFTAWVADHHRPLLNFAQLVAGDAATGEDLLQIALARAYLKWSKISASGEHPLGYVGESSSMRTLRSGDAHGSAERDQYQKQEQSIRRQLTQRGKW